MGRLLAELDPPHPSWYLDTIGVEPSEQRTGLGAALLSTMLLRIDEQALPSFLDTSAPDNLGYYERFGFPSHGRVQTTQWTSLMGNDQTARAPVYLSDAYNRTVPTRLDKSRTFTLRCPADVAVTGLAAHPCEGSDAPCCGPIQPASRFLLRSLEE